MKLLIVADGHYYIDEKEDVYVESVFDYSFYSRYLASFDEVYAIARVKKVKNAPPNSKLASGEGVHFLPIPETRGLKAYLKSYVQTKKTIEEYIKDFDCAIFRVPGVVANLVYSLYKKTNKPYALEVVVDPWEYFAKGTVKRLSRPIVRIAWTHSLKKMCSKAKGVSYVTSEYLQNKYPCPAIKTPSPEYFTASYSSVELPDELFATPKTYVSKDKYVISHVANAFTGYGKGHITLMEATKVVIDKGYNIEVWFIGDGPLKQDFIDYSNSLGIGDNVKFLGRLPSGAEVRKTIGESDIFVFPTKAEGLPRVVLEAMAEGLPVISSPVCGIPEIISDEYLVDYNDIQGYAEKIIKLIDNVDLMTAESTRNIEISKNFKSSLLNARRKEFYDKLRRIANDR